MTNLNFTPFPILKTERLIFRALSKTDDAEIFFLRSNASINQFIERPKPKNISEANKFITKITNGIKSNEWIYWAICLKERPELIGTICLWNFSEDKTIGELGYELIPKYHRRGLMNEALKCILKFSFNSIGLNKIEAYTHKDNFSSIRLLEKNCFELDETKTDIENTSNIIYTLTK